ncbi:MAG: hypothetical protein QM523_10500 [Candidatus Pacebacteria bacterium]|nr:hypothetical protein [Candidatus Paceibacterota bacterium]
MTQIKHIVEQIDQVLKMAARYSVMSVNINIQRNVIEMINNASSKNIINLEKSIRKNDDFLSNLFKSSDISFKFFKSLLQFMVYMKENNAEEAWNRLIEAQNLLSLSVQINPSQFGFDKYIKELDDYERLLFPKQVFLSPAYYSDNLECTICNNSLFKCNHITGQLYSGKICQLRITKLNLDHIAIVDDPLDKRRRVTSTEQEDYTYENTITLERTPMTHKEIEQSKNDGGKTKGFKAMVIHRNEEL